MSKVITLNKTSFFTDYIQNNGFYFFIQIDSYIHQDIDSCNEDNQEIKDLFLTNPLYKDEITQDSAISIKNTIFSFSETLQNSRQLLGFTVTTLSKILQVTRPTVYSYLEGKTPTNKIVQNKINKIHEVLTLLSCQLGPRNNYFSLTKKFDSQGKNLIDYLSTNKEISGFINVLCKNELDRPKIIIKHKQKSISNAFYSVPAFFNED